MKPDTHPEYNPVVFKDGEYEIVTRSTVTSERTREIDGEEHYVIPIDISAYTHPFYTGQKKLVDTEGRVDRFFKRYNLDNPEDEAEDQETAADEQAEEESSEAEETTEGEETAEDQE